MEKFLIGMGIILIPTFIYIIKKVNNLSKYTIFLEDEYFNLINLLKSSNPQEKNIILEKAVKTSLYKKIECDNADGITKFKHMNETNNFTISENNDRPDGI